MIHVGHSTLRNLAGIIWIIVGARLFSLGLMLLSPANIREMSLVNPFLPMLWTAGCLALGAIKGHFVLKKSVVQNLARIKGLPPLAPIYSIYTRKQVLLIMFMMLLGISMKYLPLPELVRATVDLSVGTALLYGGSCYFTLKSSQS